MKILNKSGWCNTANKPWSLLLFCPQHCVQHCQDVCKHKKILPISFTLWANPWIAAIKVTYFNVLNVVYILYTVHTDNKLIRNNWKNGLSKKKCRSCWIVQDKRDHWMVWWVWEWCRSYTVAFTVKRSQLNFYGRFWTNMLDSPPHHHHPNTRLRESMPGRRLGRGHLTHLLSLDMLVFPLSRQPSSPYICSTFRLPLFLFNFWILLELSNPWQKRLHFCHSDVITAWYYI